MEIEASDESRVRRGIVEATVQHFALLSETQDVNAKVAVASANAFSCVTRLGESLAKLQTLSESMTRTGQLWRREKHIALGAVTQHQKLLAFLEAPVVLDDCIRSEMYHEALMVLEHVTRSSPDVELFRRVEVAVRGTLENALSATVLPRLAEQLTVASAVKVTTFLRRLGVGEGEIRRLFLCQRAVYVDRLLREAESGGVPYSRLFRAVTVFKVHVSEVILQFTACFSPDAAGAARGELATWCNERAFVFVDAFRSSLAKLNSGSELAAVMEQCHGGAATAASVHMDVSALLNEAMVGRAKALFAEQMALAAQSYTASMSTFSWRLPSTAPWNAPAPRQTDADPSNAPPLSLVQWLPLAYAMNGFLTAFNTVRKCMVPGMAGFCAGQVAGLVRTMAVDLARDKELLMAVEGGERRAYLLFVDAFVNAFYPHILACVRMLLGEEALRILTSEVRRGVESLRSILPDEGHMEPTDTQRQPQQKPSSAVQPHHAQQALFNSVPQQHPASDSAKKD